MSDDIQKLKIDTSVMTKDAICEKHGTYQSKGVLGGKFWLGCPICQDRRSEEQKAAETERERDCEDKKGATFQTRSDALAKHAPSDRRQGPLQRSLDVPWEHGTPPASSQWESSS